VKRAASLVVVHKPGVAHATPPRGLASADKSRVSLTGMLLAENTVVAGRFRLNRLLGRGGMGSVWHATHLSLDIPCAVKFIEGDLGQHAEARARFEREAKATALLRSPHVVQILDHGVSDGMPYIAMELLEGEDLGKRLARVKQLPSAKIVTIARQVERALARAHGVGIVHRDLKPDNIFLVRDPDGEIVKVLDFGIAKMRSDASVLSETKTGVMLGTPYYMSPEQAQGTRSVDFRSDLWSLAVIVFQCATGKHPFESDAIADLMLKIMVAQLPTASAVAPVPAAFDAWWVRAAARDPAQRFQSARELVDALAIALAVASDGAEGRSPRDSALERAAASAAGAAISPQASTVAAPASPAAPVPLTPPPGAAATGAAVAHTFHELARPSTGRSAVWGLCGFALLAALGFAALRFLRPTSVATPSAQAAPVTSAAGVPSAAATVAPEAIPSARMQPSAAPTPSTALALPPPPAPTHARPRRGAPKLQVSPPPSPSVRPGPNPAPPPATSADPTGF
jgi:hypothetical protein